MRPFFRSKLVLPAAVAALVASCRREAEAPLPPEDDLYVYSQKVAERALRLVPGERALGTFYLGRVHQRFGHEDEALKAYAEASRFDPDLLEPHQETGFILSQRNERHPEAIAAYYRALQIDPRARGVKTRLGLIFLHQNRLEDAERVLRQEIQDQTGNDLTHYNLGQTLALLNRHEEAVAEFEEALRMDPRNRMGHYALSQSLDALGRKDEAKKAFEEFRRLKKEEDEATPESRLGSSNLDEQRRATAGAWLDAAVLFGLGRNRERDPAKRRKLDEEFLRALRESIRFDPTSSDAWELLVDDCDRRGQTEQAIAECREGLQRAPSQQLVQMAFALISKNLERLPKEGPERARRVAGAVEILEAVTKVAPDFAGAHLELARAILFVGGRDRALLQKALEHAEAAARLDPNARTLDVLAFALLENGDVEKAREKLEEALRLFPGDEELRGRLKKFEQRFPRP
ncbi:MAG: tetratricopeptide repeat protein [Planctomycetota bacterium]